jgi:uncharacterized membrane protein YesL
MLYSRMHLVAIRPPQPAPSLLPEVWLNVSAWLITLAGVITFGFMIWSRSKGNARRAKLLNVVLMGLLALMWTDQYLLEPDMLSNFQDRGTWLYLIGGTGIFLVLVTSLVELFRTQSHSEMNLKQRIVSMGLAVLGLAGVLVVTWVPGMFPHVPFLQ